MKKALKVLASCLLVIILIASTVVPTLAAAPTINISEQRIALYAGQTKVLKITGTTAAVSWSTSAPAIAAVDGNGTVTAKTAGTATVKATVGNTVKTCTVTVKARLEATKLSLYPDQKDTVNLLGAKIKSVTSSKPSVASVNNKGVITSKKAGSTVITYKDTKGKKYTLKLTVKKPQLETKSISIFPYEKKTVKLLGAKIKSVTSSKSSIAAASKKGVVTAKKAGKTTITYKDTKGKKYTLKVTVKKPQLEKTKATVGLGTKTTIKLLGAKIKSVTSSKKSVATVNKKGVVTAKKVGTTKLTYKDTAGKKYVCTVKVVIIKAKSIALSQTAATLNVGGSQVLTATVLPSDTTNKAVTWVSSNTSVVTVTAGSNGKATVVAKKPGKATVKVATKDGSKLSKACVVTVESSAIVTNQAQLNSVLAMNLENVTLKTNAVSQFVIAAGNYPNTKLVIDAPNAEVINSANFKELEILAIANNTHIEKAFGNSIICKALNGKIEIAEGAKAEITVSNTATGKTPDIKLVNNGDIEKLAIDTEAKIDITGSQTSIAIPVVVTPKAQDSKIKTDKKLDVVAESKVELVIKPGAEETTASVSDDANIPSVSGLGSVTITDTATGEVKDTVVAEKTDEIVSWSVNVSGKVTYAVDSQAMPNVKIHLLHFDKTINTNNISALLRDDNHKATTDQNGDYSFEAEIGNYYLIAVYEGYKTNIQTLCITSINESNYNNAVIVMSEDVDQTGNITGIFTDALTGERIDYGVMLKVREGTNNVSGVPLRTIDVPASSFGSYEITDLPAGAYTVQVMSSLYDEVKVSASSYNVVVLPEDTVTANATVTRHIENGQVRFVLEWAAQNTNVPSDLDSHLVGPTPNSARRFHTWYSDMGYYYQENKYADLDVDDTSWEGPETTTIYQKTPGLYSFYIYDFTNQHDEYSNLMSDYSAAFVKVYEGNVLRQTFYIPTGKQGNLWHVCDYNSVTGQIVSVNEVKYWPANESGSVGMSERDVLISRIENSTLNLESQLETLADGTYKTNVIKAISDAKAASNNPNSSLEALREAAATLEDYINELECCAYIRVNGDNIGYDRYSNRIVIYGTTPELSDVTFSAYDYDDNEIPVTVSDVTDEEYVKTLTVTNSDLGITKIWYVYYEISFDVFQIESIVGDGISHFNQLNEQLEIFGYAEEMPDFELLFNEQYADLLTYEIEAVDDESNVAILKIKYANKTKELRVYYHKIIEAFDIVNIAGEGISRYSINRYPYEGSIYIYGYAASLPEFTVELKDEYKDLVTLEIENYGNDYSNEAIIRLKYNEEIYNYYIYYYLDSEAFGIKNLSGNGIYKWNHAAYYSSGEIEIYGFEQELSEFDVEFIGQGLTAELEAGSSTNRPILNVYYDGQLVFYYNVYYYRGNQGFNITEIENATVTRFDTSLYYEDPIGELYIYSPSGEHIDFDVKFADSVHTDMTYYFEECDSEEEYDRLLKVSYKDTYFFTYYVYYCIDSNIFEIDNVTGDLLTSWNYWNSRYNGYGELSLYGPSKEEFDFSLTFTDEYKDDLKYSLETVDRDEYNYDKLLTVTYKDIYTYKYHVSFFLDDNIYSVEDAIGDGITSIDCSLYTDYGELYIRSASKNECNFTPVFNEKYAQDIDYAISEADSEDYCDKLLTVTYKDIYTFTYKVYFTTDYNIYRISDINCDVITYWDWGRNSQYDHGYLYLYGPSDSEYEFTPVFNTTYGSELEYTISEATDNTYDKLLTVTYKGVYTYIYKVIFSVDTSIYRINEVTGDALTSWDTYYNYDSETDEEYRELRLYGPSNEEFDFTPEFSERYSNDITYELIDSDKEGYSKILKVIYKGTYSYNYYVKYCIDSEIYYIDQVDGTLITNYYTMSDYDDDTDSYFPVLRIYGPSNEEFDFTPKFSEYYGNDITYELIDSDREDYSKILKVIYKGTYSYSYYVSYIFDNEIFDVTSIYHPNVFAYNTRENYNSNETINVYGNISDLSELEIFFNEKYSEFLDYTFEEPDLESVADMVLVVSVKNCAYTYSYDIIYHQATVSDIELDTEVEIALYDSPNRFFAFTPSETGIYNFKSYENNCDPKVHLYYDAQEIAYSDDESDNNFSLSCELEEGKTYYFFATTFSGSNGAYKAILTKTE